MATFTVQLQIPDTLRELGYGEDEIQKELPMLLVLRRFRQGAISSGKAASLLGMSRRDFFELLGREGIPIYNPTDEELEEEFRTVQRLQG